MKIIIAGPPHSGKSVFLASLIKLLPSDSYDTVRANKDGEGYWSNNENEKQTKAARVKETYDEDFIKERCELIKRINKPIVLVDIGGRLYPDKEPIFRTCDSFIVLSNDIDEHHCHEWKAFGEYWGAKCIAILRSFIMKENSDNDDVYDEITQDIPGHIFEGKLYNLDRGTFHHDSPVIKRIADLIIEQSGYKQKKINDSSVIDFNQIAEKIGCVKKRNLGDAEIKYDVLFSKEVIPSLCDYLENLEYKYSYILTGARANWVSAISVNILFKNKCEEILLFDTENTGNVKIKIINQQDESDRFRVTEKQDYILLELKENRYFLVEELNNLVLPKISKEKALFISGRMPLWLLDSIVLSYENSEKYVYQPGNGYFCVTSEDKNMLGSCKKELE